MLNRRSLFAASLVAMLAGCATPSAPVSVADTLARDPQLSTLNGLVQQAGLADMLRGAGPYTVFAPTNDAFRAVPANAMAELQD
ncbi:MAG: fasciclin protein, partial [Ramlibacter sp.]|nr:fasciclin protein [Ramlibacter sp.]